MQVVARSQGGDVTFGTNRVIERELMTDAIHPVILRVPEGLQKARFIIGKKSVVVVSISCRQNI